MRRMTLACTALAALSGAAHATGALPQAYRQALAVAGIPAQDTAVVVESLDSQRDANIAWNAGAAMNPASTMKLVTTYAALHLLGPNHTWRTEAMSAAPLQGEVLRGDLAFRGGGDPKIVIEQLWLLIYRIRAYGIRELAGDVWLDKRAFAPIAHDPDEFDGAGDRAYNVGPDALLVNFKALAFHFVPDPIAGNARVVVLPPLAQLRAPATVSGATGMACGNWRARLRADFSSPLTPRFNGSYPLACGERAWYVGALEHDKYFEQVFRALWTSLGGRWSGRLRLGPVPAGARLLATHESPPLALAIRDINKFSNNVMARHLFLTLGTAANPAADPTPATPARGAAVVRTWLAGRAIAAPELVLENGAGLSRVERVSAATLARLLVDADRSEYAADFIASLPISGVDGTLRERDMPRGAARLKTGLLQNARALAGFVRTRSGRRYVVVSFINHAAAASTGAQRAQDALVNWLFETG